LSTTTPRSIVPARTPVDRDEQLVEDRFTDLQKSWRTVVSDELRKRASRFAELAALPARALRSRATIADGERLVFTYTPGVERELRAAIAAGGELLRVPAPGPGAHRRRPGPRHRRPAGCPADHRGALRVSVPQKALGAGALVMAFAARCRRRPALWSVVA
jgi:hypothetical protein